MGIKMDIQFFGHNCFVVGNEKAQIIIDPWLTDKGAFFGSWYQWPLNHASKPLLLEQTARKQSYVYISHEHQDHFDVETLTELRAHCSNAFIPEYYDKFLRNRLEAIGFEVVELCDNAEFRIAEGFTVRLLIVDTGVNHDSAALIKVGDELFINQNDCKIFDRLQTIKEKVTYYAVQFSGATWHPVCYTYSPEVKREISRKKVNSKLIAIRNMVRHLKPDFYFPSAGPAIFPFLDPELSSGDDNIFVHQPILEKLLKNEDTKLVYLKPGDSFSRTVETFPIAAPSSSQISALAETLLNSWQKFDVPFDVNQLAEAVRARLSQIKDLKFEKCPILVFNWGRDEKIDGLSIDLNSSDLRPVSELPEGNFMLVSAERKYFSLMSDVSNRWQDVYLSLRATVTRSPDIFNTFINIFLFSDVDNIRKAFQTTLNIGEDRIVKIDPNTGQNYELNRYCPHNGADLINAEVDAGGNLICPRHAWKFRLADHGNCLETGASIKAIELENTITLCETISARLTKPNRQCSGSKQIIPDNPAV
jgi:UDP-MurNAc hydroxylase